MSVYRVHIWTFYLINSLIHYSFLHCLPVFPPECLSVADGEAAVSQLAQTLQACIELNDPVQQVKLIKKVGLFGRQCKVPVRYVCFSPMVTSHSVSTLLQAGSQLRCLGEEQKGGALVLLGSCLQTLGLLYVSLTPKNPLRSAIARSIYTVYIFFYLKLFKLRFFFNVIATFQTFTF